MSDVRDKVLKIISEHQYENQCAAWTCDCGASFGPPAVEGVDWEHHITDVLMNELNLT